MYPGGFLPVERWWLVALLSPSPVVNVVSWVSICTQMFHGMAIFTKPFPLQIGPSFGLLIHTFGAFFGYNNCTFWDAVRSWMIFWKMMLEKFNPVKSHLKMAWLRVTCVYLLAHRHTGPKLSLPEFCGIFYPPYSWFAWKSWASKGPTPFNVHAYPPKKNIAGLVEELWSPPSSP